MMNTSTKNSALISLGCATGWFLASCVYGVIAFLFVEFQGDSWLRQSILLHVPLLLVLTVAHLRQREDPDECLGMRLSLTVSAPLAFVLSLMPTGSF